MIPASPHDKLGRLAGSAAIRALAMILCALLAACSDDEAEDDPYLEFAGGGFVFNYRLATAEYGFIARVTREITPGTIIEAEFENPSGGAPFVIRQSAVEGVPSYVFRTPPVQGVEAMRDYLVELRLLESGSGQVIAEYSRTFRSDIGQDVLPKSPTVVGPGYQQPD